MHRKKHWAIAAACYAATLGILYILSMDLEQTRVEVIGIWGMLCVHLMYQAHMHFAIGACGKEGFTESNRIWFRNVEKEVLVVVSAGALFMYGATHETLLGGIAIVGAIALIALQLRLLWKRLLSTPISTYLFDDISAERAQEMKWNFNAAVWMVAPVSIGTMAGMLFMFAGAFWLAAFGEESMEILRAPFARCLLGANAAFLISGLFFAPEYMNGLTILKVTNFEPRCKSPV